MEKTSKVINKMYNETELNKLENVTKEFFGWHADNNKAVYRVHVKDAKRTYLDVCIDCSYLLVDDELKIDFKSDKVKKMSHRKKSHQNCFKISADLSYNEFVKLVTDETIKKSLQAKKKAQKSTEKQAEKKQKQAEKKESEKTA